MGKKGEEVGRNWEKGRRCQDARDEEAGKYQQEGRKKTEEKG